MVSIMAVEEIGMEYCCEDFKEYDGDFLAKRIGDGPSTYRIYAVDEQRASKPINFCPWCGKECKS